MSNISEVALFLKNCWYCAGWDHSVSQGKDALVERRIAGESIVLYRKPDGAVVAMEDRCPHRQAPLSQGQKEGDSIRCMYHGMKFSPNGQCTEIPGQEHIPEKACVRVYPVVEKDNWIWVWLGEPAKADPALICSAVGPSDSNWNMKSSQIHVKTNYRLEIANLMDLSHISWTHRATFGGTQAYSKTRAQHVVTPRGVNTKFVVRNVPPPTFAQHLFPSDAKFDLDFDVEFSVPCNFILHFRVWTAGTATEGPSNGQLVLDTYTCQAVTPRDADSVDYYYSWGPSRQTDSPGMSDMLHEANVAAFIEDKTMLEGQYARLKERPDGNKVDIAQDAGGGKMLWVLDKLLKQEASNAAKKAA